MNPMQIRDLCFWRKFGTPPLEKQSQSRPAIGLDGGESLLVKPHTFASLKQ